MAVARYSFGRLRRAAVARPEAVPPGAPVPLRAALVHAVPTRLLIPAIGLSAPLGRVGRDGAGAIPTPPRDEPDHACWLASGPSPGEPGAALVLGHLDTASGPAVFARLGELRPGEIIGVARSDGTVAVFRMIRAEQVPKRLFSEARVRLAGTVPELRLITCAGRHDEKRHAYDDNLIVYATFAAAYRAADLASMPRG
ncbi:sortase domain-bontaining protein [Actinomadura gamaensis]|uniref:Sortase domain-bontaining protein n=1 Tax=Actinomadura gamaensis TaxID=1763541 RepID=A0ABV9U4Q0_9ACTN